MKSINKKWIHVIKGIILVIFTATGTFAQKDAEGCKDHPMFTRMQNFHITECEQKKYAMMDFRDNKGEEKKVEGKYYRVEYYINKNITPPSFLTIIRNHQNAIKKIGGVVVYEDIVDNGGATYMELKKKGSTYWVYLDAYDEKYSLVIVEKSRMKQEVVADVKSLMNDIHLTGHASVYGIYFDFNKADIKPQSEPAIKEIAKLLKQNPSLKLYVVGHTDNVGTLDYNMKLSKARADAVMKELVTKYKISDQRLKAYGVASLAPVASNDTEEGRAKNRRVELVEQ